MSSDDALAEQDPHELDTAQNLKLDNFPPEVYDEVMRLRKLQRHKLQMEEFETIARKKLLKKLVDTITSLKAEKADQDRSWGQLKDQLQEFEEKKQAWEKMKCEWEETMSRRERRVNCMTVEEAMAPGGTTPFTDHSDINGDGDDDDDDDDEKWSENHPTPAVSPEMHSSPITPTVASVCDGATGRAKSPPPKARPHQRALKRSLSISSDPS